MNEKTRKMETHWYLIVNEECVLCGAGGEHRVRQYGQKPEKWEDCHKRIEYVCGEHYEYWH